MRFATIDQVGRRFGMGRTAAYRRTQALSHWGLLRRTNTYLPEGPAVLLVTRLGLQLSGSTLKLPEVDLRQFVHDKELVEVATDHELAGARVYSDREIRSVARAILDKKGRFRFEVGHLRGRYRRAYHYPDLIVERPEFRFAVELEFADKGSRRLKQILEGYALAREIDAVVYLVREPALAARIERIIGGSACTTGRAFGCMRGGPGDAALHNSGGC